jgi:hypothetical protein
VGKTLWINPVDNRVDGGADPVDEMGMTGGPSVDEMGTHLDCPQASTESTGSMHSDGGQRFGGLPAKTRVFPSIHGP